MKTRKDAWNEKEDALLVEAILKHLQVGSSMTNAFTEASKELGRTVTACSVRWSTALKERYEMTMEFTKKSTKPLPKDKKARRLAKEHTKEQTKESLLQEELEHAVKVVSRHLKEYVKHKRSFENIEDIQRELEQLREEVHLLKQEKEELKKSTTDKNQLIS